jgi:hypothetical protein
MVDHERHVLLVLEKLQKVGFYAKLEKCGFYQSKVEFLGYIISRDGVHMDPCKVQTIVDWATPASIQDVQCFLGLANFYQQFSAHYSTIVTPFYSFNLEDQPFSWGVETKNAFQYLKASFTTTPFFIHVNPSKPFVLETDTSDFTLCVILSQSEEDYLLHLVGFYFRKFLPIEINYEIHDKKLLAIVDTFEEWCHLLEKAQHKIIVYSDHKNL